MQGAQTLCIDYNDQNDYKCEQKKYIKKFPDMLEKGFSFKI